MIFGICCSSFRGEYNIVIIGNRLRELRENLSLSQGDIERRTGLLRCYISRVEHGHTVPGVETLEKFARALEVPLYQIFYISKEPASLRPIKAESALWGSSGKDASILAQFRRHLSNVKESDRQLLLHMARKLARGRPA
jgi:transcriptional regulator with XRE-family HTH domain